MVKLSERHRYVIQFTSMTQTNEETSYRKAIMIFVKKKISKNLKFQNFNVESMEEDAAEKLLPLSTQQIRIIPSSCVGLLVPCIDGDTLNAVLKLCLRLIRLRN